MRWYVLLFVVAFLVRSGLATLAQYPGLYDPKHYYNLARNLAEGRGFVIDHILHYHRRPEAVTHPVDHWMPLPGRTSQSRIYGIAGMP